jgi:S-adenosylmethionine:tRNA ribosyltransferase-isomerase
LTLHVSYGTFKPINQQDLEKGKLHSEYFCINKETASILNKAKSQGSRIVAVGTTSCRALESAVENGRIKSKEKETDLFIYPPYKFKVTDCLLTNFHLPRSSLLMLVSAFCSDADELDFDEGYKLLMKAYSEAIDKRYHFYSYGDAMFIY